MRSIDIKRFVLLATVIVGLSALAPQWTGETAEEVVEHLPGVSKDLIHPHAGIMGATAHAGGKIRHPEIDPVTSQNKS